MKTNTLIILAVLAATLPQTPRAQGLRESIVEFLDRIGGQGRDPCLDETRATGLLETINHSNAVEFMGEELSLLNLAQQSLDMQCQQWHADDIRQQELELLLERCEELGEARAFCRIVIKCREVQEMSPRMAAFWGASVQRCPQ